MMLSDSEIMSSWRARRRDFGQVAADARGLGPELATDPWQPVRTGLLTGVLIWATTRILDYLMEGKR